MGVWPLTAFRTAAGGGRLRLVALAAACALAATARAEEPAWQVAGQQGLMRFVIVPASQARDRAAYEREIRRLCEPDRTCFLNFYTNSTAAPLAVPLPDSIDREATATFRRSSKQGAERFMWSCRLQQVTDACF
jgi:hypothetical protein